MSTQSWDQKFMGLARYISGWSKDPSTKVGAVVVDDRNCVRSLGYNGFPRGVRDLPERLANREQKLRLTVHAEVNAVLNAPVPIVGCRVYVTCSPCASCAAKLVQAGISHVIAPVASQDPFAQRADWEEDVREALVVFKEAHVLISFIEYLGTIEDLA